jgi:hypothetical protein
VFVISRFGSLEAPQEKVLMFQADGEYVGDFEISAGAPRDLAVWQDQLVVLAASDDPTQTEQGGLAVFTLDDPNAVPRFSHLVAFPDGVAPEKRLGDGVEFLNGTFYVSESRGGEIHQISASGQLLQTFQLQALGEMPDVITDFVVVVPEPPGCAILLLISVAGAFGRYRWP